MYTSSPLWLAFPVSREVPPIEGSRFLVDLAGAVALLLWGLRMVRTGINRSYGGHLRRVLSQSLDHRATAFLAGFGVTAILQSSTATALMTASFAGQGLIATGTALVVMLGADVGTAFVARVLSFDIHWLSPMLLVVGLLSFIWAGPTRVRDLGRVWIGLGLMLLALRLIVGASQPLGHSAVVIEVLAALADDPLLAVLLGALLTAALHSSLAFVLMAASLAGTGVIPVQLGLLLVLGANIGGTLPPTLATWAGGPPARRVTLGNAGFKCSAALVAALALDPVHEALSWIVSAPAAAVATFHVAFNLATALVFIGLTGLIGRLAERLLPDRPIAGDEARPIYLDENALETPSVALACASREIMRMADTLKEMLELTRAALSNDDRRALVRVGELDDVLDNLNEAVKLYLTRLSREAQQDKDSRRGSEILLFATNLEHAGDIIDKSLADIVRRKLKHKLHFSDQGMAEINAVYDRVEENLTLATSVFLTADIPAARRLVSEKAELRRLELEAGRNHLERLSERLAESIQTSALHMDVVRDLRHINSHLVSAAYPLLDAAGLLRDTRLRKARPAIG
ncbi:MAG: Na/Pi cotransporter family protein [Acetobacterales bacterium]